jgi:hypothetical protein
LLFDQAMAGIQDSPLHDQGVEETQVVLAGVDR